MLNNNNSTSKGKWILHHFISNLSINILGGFLLTLGDFILIHFVRPETQIDENVFQMIGFYSLYYFVMTYPALYFLILIFLTILTVKSKLSFVVIMVIGLLLSLLFGIVTENATWSFYIHDEKKIKYIIVVSLAGFCYPAISHFVQKKLKLKTEVR